MTSQPYNNVLEMIGHTPLIAVTHIDTGPCRLFLKLENQNPGGSIKDRVGLYLIQAAERDGRLQPGGTLIEATAGNTGLGLALVAAQKGYRLLLVIPDKMSQEKIFHLKAMGGRGCTHPLGCQQGPPGILPAMSPSVSPGETPNSFFVNQFGNPANPQAPRGNDRARDLGADESRARCRGLRCWNGAARSRASRAFSRARLPAWRWCWRILPAPSSRSMRRLEKSRPARGGWLVEGIGGDSIPPVADFSRVGTTYNIPDAEAFQTCRELLLKEGDYRGHVHRDAAGRRPALLPRAATAQARRDFRLRQRQQIPVEGLQRLLDVGPGVCPARAVSVICATLIARRAWERAAVTVNSTELVMAAYRRMKLYDVSQLPVMHEGRIVGIVDEEDILLEVFENPQHFNEPVTKAMESHLVTVPVDAPLPQLLELFKAGPGGDRDEGNRVPGTGDPYRCVELAAPENLMSADGDKQRFATRVNTRGTESRPVDRCGDAADLRHLHVCAVEPPASIRVTTTRARAIQHATRCRRPWQTSKAVQPGSRSLPEWRPPRPCWS